MSSAIASSRRTSGRCARGCAAPPPTSSLTAIASAWSSTGRRCGGRTPRWRRCIRNGAAMATPGGATSTRSSPSNTPTAAWRSRIWLTSPFYHLIDRARGGEENVVDAPASGDRSGSARLPGAGRNYFAAGSDGLRRLSLRLRQGRRPLAGNRASSIPSRPTGKAASTTTTRRSCKRPCRRFRWR